MVRWSAPPKEKSMVGVINCQTENPNFNFGKPIRFQSPVHPTEFVLQFTRDGFAPPFMDPIPKEVRPHMANLFPEAIDDLKERAFGWPVVYWNFDHDTAAWHENSVHLAKIAGCVRDSIEVPKHEGGKNHCSGAIRDGQRLAIGDIKGGIRNVPSGQFNYIR
jgi:hypothetical protein